MQNYIVEHHKIVDGIRDGEQVKISVWMDFSSSKITHGVNITIKEANKGRFINPFTDPDYRKTVISTLTDNGRIYLDSLEHWIGDNEIIETFKELTDSLTPKTVGIRNQLEIIR